MVDSGYSPLRWLLLAAVSLGYVTSSASLVALAPLLEGIADSMKLDMATASNFMMVTSLFSVVGMISGGFLADRFGVLWLLLLGTIGAALPSVLLPWIGNAYLPILVVRMAQGASFGFLLCLMAPLVGGWFPLRQRGLASGIMGMSVSVGFGLGASAGPALTGALHSWQKMSACLSLFAWLGVALTLIAAFRPQWKPAYEAELPHAATSEGSFKSALCSGVTWIGIAMTFFAQWSMQTSQLTIPSFLASGSPVGVGFGPALTGRLMLVFMVAGMVGPVIAGILQDKIFPHNPKPVMLLGFCLCTFIFAMAYPLVRSSTMLVGLDLILFGVGLQFIFPCLPVYISHAYPLDIAGKILGCWLGIGALGGVAGMAAVKFTLVVSSSYLPVISQIALASLCGLLLVLFLRPPQSA